MPERQADSRQQPTSGRLLVAIRPDEWGFALVRAGERLAAALATPWTVVSVETPAMLRLGEAARDRRVAILREAELRGAETVTLDGPSAAAVLLEYAALRGATCMLVGRPRRQGVRARWPRPVAVALLRGARSFDVLVVAGGEAASPAGEVAAAGARTAAAIPWARYAGAAAITSACTLIAMLMDPWLAVTNLVMVYLLGATVAGLRLGRGPSVVTSVLNVLAFNFFFVPPRLTFAVADGQFLVTFAVMLAVALTIATLTASVRQQTRVAGARERRTASLYAMSRELAEARGVDAMAAIAIKHVAETFSAAVTVLLPDPGGRLSPRPQSVDTHTLAQFDRELAQAVYAGGRTGGLGTERAARIPAIYLPLAGTRGPLGVLVAQPDKPRRVLLPEQRHLLETFTGQLALAMERAQIAEAAHAAHVAAETERLRNTLLASISHDLRTPLAVIAGAGSALADPRLELSAQARARLAASIEAKARDMSDLVSDVLDLMRFEAGRIVLRQDWQTLDDLVGTALRRVSPRLEGHVVTISLPDDLPPVHVDASLVTQVLANLLENAARHTPAGTHVTVSARMATDWLQVSVADTGPGLAPGGAERLFAKFERGRDEGIGGGAGLGLAICRAIVEAHGGRISASDAPGGGAQFDFTLPLGPEQP